MNQPRAPQPDAPAHGPSAVESANQGDVWLAPAADVQRRLWYLAQLDPASPSYNVPTTLRLTGPVRPDALERAVNRVVQRHEVLRTTFTLRHNELMQMIAPALHVPLSVVDMRLLTPEEREPGWRQVAADEGARVFDLERGPLIRVTLLILGPLEFVLQVTVHHVVFDGWSSAILIRELAECYAAAVEGREPILPDLPIQYADFAAFQKEHAAGADLDAQLRYWTDALAGAPTALDLPTDHPRPPVQSARGALETAPMSGALWQAVTTFGRGESATAFMTLVAAFGVVLHRWSGQDTVLIGCPWAGRERPEIEGLIGFFINTFVLRIDASGDPTFRELVARVRLACQAAYAHQDAPFDRLVEKLNPERSLDRHPIFQVMFALDPPPSRVALAGIEIERVVVHNGTAKCDLMLEVAGGADTAALYAEYSLDLFERPTIAALVERFQRVLGAALTDPDRRLSELPMIGDDERVRLLRQAAGPAADYPRDRSIAALFEAQAGRTPDAVAVTCDGQHLSYADLSRRANQLARVLKARGVGPDTLVGVALDRSFDLIVALLAVAKAGGAYLPVDLSYPRDRLAYMLADAATPLVITRRHLIGALPPAELLFLDDPSLGMSSQRDDDLPSSAGGDHLAYVMYTSGSTGQPKGVAVPHRAVARLVCGTDYVRWSDVGTMLHMAPASFDASTFEIWGALLNGARVVLIADRLVSLELLERTLRSEHVDCLWLTAALFNTVIDAKPGMLAGVRQLVVGGEALSVAHVRRALAHLPDTQLVNGYGPTESTTFACTYRIPRQLDPQATSIPIGRPIANTQAYVLDRTRSLVPNGVTGELYIGGDGLARDYLRQPALTAERFVPDPFAAWAGARLYRTGDLARWLPDGNLEFLGRVDRQIKLRGFRIELGEIEHALRASGSVRDAVVEIRTDIDVPHLIAYLVPAEGCAPAASDLRTQLKSRLPDYMVPSEFVVLPALPLTPNGKVDRSALPSGPGVSAVEPGPDTWASDLEADLAQIWRDVLGVSAIAPTDNFFDLGGNSLLAILLFSRIYDRFGRSLPIVTLFEQPTIRGLAALLPAKIAPTPNSTLLRLSANGQKPPILLMHGVDGGLWDSIRLAQHLGDRQVFGLQTMATEESVDVSIEAIAARCLREIREKVPNGPYHIGGFCAAAKTAVEVAQQLRAEGQEVGLVAVFDYGMDEPPLPRSIAGAAVDFLRNLPLWIAYDLIPVGPRRIAGRLRSRFRLGRHAVERRLGLRQTAAEPDIRDALGMWMYTAEQAKTLSILWRAFERYTLRPYAGRLVLFRPRAEPLVPLRRPRDLGWGRIASGGIEVITVLGSHETMLEEKFVRGVAAKLAEVLDRADGAAVDQAVAPEEPKL